MFHKEGAPSILLGTVFAVAVLLIADKFIDITWLRMLVQIAGVVILIIILQFFRNPKRIAINNSDHILAPVDGKGDVGNLLADDRGINHVNLL